MPIKFAVGDITKLKVQAIVNAANRTLLGGGGVDGAIHRAAGPELLEYNKKLGGAKTTEVKASPGFNLDVEYILHAVGPVYRDGTYNEEKNLYQTYINALNLANSLNINEIAFPLISAGAYKFPKDLAIKAAITAILDFLEENEMTVILVFYDRLMIENISDDSVELIKLITNNLDNSYFDY